MSCNQDEFLICTIASLLESSRHVAVGMASPVPGSAALLVREETKGQIDRLRLSMIGGKANINLIGTGDYPNMDHRFPGSFGSAYMYFVVPRVILFRPEHSKRVFVPEVDYISAPGTSEEGVYRPGGPYALVTELCLMMFNRERKRFRLTSVHPGHSVEEVRDNTGFEFDLPEDVPETSGPTDGRLDLLRSRISPEIAKTYPEFVARVFETAV
jgi:glutaconate CoA-transferase subunit B